MNINIGTILTLVIGIFTFGFVKGGNNERNKRTKKAIKVAKRANKIRQDIDNNSPDNNRAKLRKWARK